MSKRKTPATSAESGDAAGDTKAAKPKAAVPAAMSMSAANAAVTAAMAPLLKGDRKSSGGGSTDPAHCSPSVNSVVFPGDVIALRAHSKVRIGPGLLQSGDSVVACKWGVLRQIGSNKLWIDHQQKRYIAMVEDMVVGTVLERHAENYRIDFNSTAPARLSHLAFEGASKRNKPNLAVGALVYARVISANKDVETEIACTSPHFKKDWVTGENLFGELTDGFTFKCSLALARTLLDEDCAVLKALAKRIPFEVAIGANGIVWVRASSTLHTVIVCQCIQLTENESEAFVEATVKQLCDKLIPE